MNNLILFLPILSGIMFGSAGVFVRSLLGYGMSGISVIFLRFAFAAAELLIVILLTDRRLLKLKLRDLPLFMGTGLGCMFGLNLAYNTSITYLPLSLAAILLSLAPVIVLFLSAILFKEKITAKKIICMIMAIIGCALAGGILEQHSGMILSGLGIAAGLIAAFFYALYSILSKTASSRGNHTYTIIFYSVLIIAAVTAPFAEYDIIGSYISEAPMPHMLFLTAHALCISVLPYVFITTAQLYADAGYVYILASGGEPVAAVVFGMIFFGEMPTAVGIIGMLITITALTVLCLKPAAGKG